MEGDPGPPWCFRVLPATWDAEAGRYRESRRLGPAWETQQGGETLDHKGWVVGKDGEEEKRP